MSISWCVGGEGGTGKGQQWHGICRKHPECMLQPLQAGEPPCGRVDACAPPPLPHTLVPLVRFPSAQPLCIHRHHECAEAQPLSGTHPASNHVSVTAALAGKEKGVSRRDRKRCEHQGVGQQGMGRCGRGVRHREESTAAGPALVAWLRSLDDARGIADQTVTGPCLCSFHLCTHAACRSQRCA